MPREIDNSFYMLVKNEYGKYDYRSVTPKHAISGDTDSVYIDLGIRFDKDADKDDVIRFADYIGETVNDAFPEYIQGVFNIPDDRVDIIQTDREVVADKAYFLKKKHYVMHIIDNEGVSVDKLKIMGVSIKKSSTPVVIQRFLTDLVNKLMDGESKELIDQFIEEFKSSYMRMSIFDIGIPSTLKALKRYEIKFSESGSYKGFPYHIKAAMMYNNMASDRDVKLVSGDKCRLVYVLNRGIDCIAFPADVTQLPKFFDDLVIDWKRQWSTVQKQIDIFYQPIGYDRKTLQSDLTNSVLVF